MSANLKQNSLPKKSRLSFLENTSPEYLEILYGQFLDDPSSVSDDWAYFFEILELGSREGTPSTGPKTTVQTNGVSDELQVMRLINAYRARGHFEADLDPLGIRKAESDAALDLKGYELDKVSPTRVFKAAKEIGLEPSTLPKILETLKKTYCGYIGIEFSHTRDVEIYDWIKQHVDRNQNHTAFTVEEKFQFLKDLGKANLFENFLQKSYVGQKRFSLEGGEALIPALNDLILSSSSMGAKEVVIGMAHRGRLTVLTQVLRKPVEEIFAEFEGAELPGGGFSGDVKYHLGFSADLKLPNDRSVHISLAPNPSHLEFVDPVIEGIVRAKQDIKFNKDTSSVVPVLIHGDGAVIGQGVVTETLNLSRLNGYSTGGTIHIVTNNQVGFTTNPEDARSTIYCTDFAKALQAPVLHVNGDHVEDVIHAIRLAVEYRMTFKRDIFIDLWCYRKYGHNEGDEPRFTQPQMYEVIGKHKNPYQQYIDQLLADHTVENAMVEEFVSTFEKDLDAKREKVKSSKRVSSADMFRGLWQGFELAKTGDLLTDVDTSIAAPVFEKVLKQIHEIPDSAHALPKFAQMIDARKKKIETTGLIDWAVGEQLAYGSLLGDGYNIRLSGQDCIRGTFSHRHAGIRNMQDGSIYFPLQNIDSQKSFSVMNSPLSETAVLGFDYGYSLADPRTLTIWEAQFGDFANGAQVIIDQFLCSAEHKWYRMSGITLLLPHGYEGQGPEHSSARLERFLQLSAQDNWQVCYPTTPAQICHLLRRQMLRKFRKPLVIMSPKSPLRMAEVVSPKEDFLKGSFQNILVTEPSKNPSRVILCSGKVYWDLLKKAAAAKALEETAFIRIEQLYPLDDEKLVSLKKKWPKASWVWCQEEPQNMGAWGYLRLLGIDQSLEMKVAARPFAASPATGNHHRHQEELEELLHKAFSL